MCALARFVAVSLAPQEGDNADEPVPYDLSLDLSGDNIAHIDCAEATELPPGVSSSALSFENSADQRLAFVAVVCDTPTDVRASAGSSSKQPPWLSPTSAAFPFTFAGGRRQAETVYLNSLSSPHREPYTSLNARHFRCVQHLHDARTRHSAVLPCVHFLTLSMMAPPIAPRRASWWWISWCASARSGASRRRRSTWRSVSLMTTCALKQEAPTPSLVHCTNCAGRARMQHAPLVEAAAHHLAVSGGGHLQRCRRLAVVSSCRMWTHHTFFLVRHCAASWLPSSDWL
jgi:hypothetical protein